MIENHETISLEDHVKNTCIVSLQACKSFAAIPSVARENGKKLQKNKESNTKSKTILSTQKDEELYVGSGGVDNENIKKKYARDELWRTIRLPGSNDMSDKIAFLTISLIIEIVVLTVL